MSEMGYGLHSCLRPEQARAEMHRWGGSEAHPCRATHLLTVAVAEGAHHGHPEETFSDATSGHPRGHFRISGQGLCHSWRFWPMLRNHNLYIFPEIFWLFVCFWCWGLNDPAAHPQEVGCSTGYLTGTRAEGCPWNWVVTPRTGGVWFFNVWFTASGMQLLSGRRRAFPRSPQGGF